MGGECRQFYCRQAYGQRVCMLHHYHNVCLDLTMLRAASERWDLTQHVFRFNQCKFCPMLEEFAALMSNNNFRFILLPPKPRRALDKCLGIPYSLGKTWVKGGVNLRALVEYFREKRDNEYYFCALLIAILTGFFLVGDFEAMDPKNN